MMGLFGFDDKFALFDVTPVENQFIAECLPSAPGDYVKVWLYGLMQCYHPTADMNVDTLSHDLEMTREEVDAAFRYWERRGLVRRIGDHPPEYRYINQKQRAASGSFSVDPAYETFSENLYGAFGNSRRLHGSEITRCYEWVEDLHLPPEVVIMLVKHMIAMKGKDFSIKSAEPTATLLAKENVRTIEDAEAVLSRERIIYEGSKKLLRHMGKRREPSKDEMALFGKWIHEWHFTQESIEAACSETVKGDPNMGYLDAILSKMHTRNGDKPIANSGDVEEALSEGRKLKELLTLLGNGSINDANLSLYKQMTQMYSHDVILLAGRECAGHNGQLEDVDKLLHSWQKRGLRNEQDVTEYIEKFRSRNRMIAELKEIWGLRKTANAAERNMLEKWQKEYGFLKEEILHAAAYANSKENPMLYLDAVLKQYHEQGIHAPEDMDKAHQSFLDGKKTGSTEQSRTRKVAGQQFSQRSYSDRTDDNDWLMKREDI